MPTERFDVAVIGAGPAGMSAATTAARHGARVVLLDEQPAVGGQIYRAVSQVSDRRRNLLGPDYAAGLGIAASFQASSALHLNDAAVWQVTPGGEVHYIRQGKAAMVSAEHVILCTGAMERPFPIPGWTLPGAMTAGAAQILLKTAGVVPAEPVVLAGCGPLLYLLGWQYVRAGVPIRALVDTTAFEDYRRAAVHLGGALRGWRYLRKGLALMRELKRAGVPFHTGACDLAVQGVAAVEALTFNAGGKAHRIDTSTLLLHQGVVPNTQFTWSLRAQHHWDDVQLCWQPDVDEWGALSVPGVSIAGDGARIGGAVAAALQGELAALGALHTMGKLPLAQRDRLAAPQRDELQRNLQIRPFLDALYRPKKSNRVPADHVIVCRCEEVSAGAIRNFVGLGCQGPNQAKAFGLCGMGPCQGRQCGLTVTEVMADARGVSPQEVGYYRIRPPIKPISLGELAALE